MFQKLVQQLRIFKYFCVASFKNILLFCYLYDFTLCKENMTYVVFVYLECIKILRPRIFERCFVDALFKMFFIICVRVHACTPMHSTRVKVRGQLVRVASFPSLLGFWESNSGLQTWQQVPLTR